MQLQNLDSTSSPRDWDEKWNSIFDNYQQDLRHAHYIRAVLNQDEKCILEIAAGSFRDMAMLRRNGLNCYGIDFSGESVARAKSKFPDFSDFIQQQSAFKLDYPENFFDVSYHNGFWVLFSDEEIQNLAAEQARVTKNRMIITVHNAHNTDFRAYFARLKKKDPLFDVRFFHQAEIVELMHETCDDITVIPVGKGKRRYEDWLIKRGWTHPTLLKTCLQLSGTRFLESSERLLCIGTPRKKP